MAHYGQHKKVQNLNNSEFKKFIYNLPKRKLQAQIASPLNSTEHLLWK